jgi:hypothetical protein
MFGHAKVARKYGQHFDRHWRWAGLDQSLRAAWAINA